MSKKYKEATFHSSMLIPWYVVDGKEDKIESSLQWMETGRAGHFFQPPDEVCHRDNLDQKMIVKTILRTDPVEGKTKIIGIRVYWWEDN